MSRTIEEIKEKGFDMHVGQDRNEEYDPIKALEYANLKVGLKTLSDPLTDINFFQKGNSKATKEEIIKAIKAENEPLLRDISALFFKSSGIYARLCRYMAYLYRYDWVVTPIILDDKIKKEKILEGFFKSLTYLDSFGVKQMFGEIALKVLLQGVYYGYKITQNGTTVLQELPPKYCRSRFSMGRKPVLEMNMQFFDNMFPDTMQRIKILNVFPAEIRKGYILYKQGKLPIDFAGDNQGWHMLDYTKTVKFNINGSNIPMLISVIPAIIDLEEAKELDKKKMMQQLLKIIIQQLPLDKNNELVFDVEEAKVLHNNVVAMLGKAVGVNVLTTFADVNVEDVSDRSATSQYDETSKVERAVFNEAGVSQQQFNAGGNLSLDKSVANDEASMSGLIYQFEAFLNDLLEPFNRNPKKLKYTVQILGTTIYNYKDLSKLYKEQMSIGFSKILPQVALGQSQSSIMSTAYFENEVLNLNELFIPPASSNTTPGGGKSTTGETGRPPLPEDQQSDKTRQNREAAS